MASLISLFLILANELLASILAIAIISFAVKPLCVNPINIIDLSNINLITSDESPLEIDFQGLSNVVNIELSNGLIGTQL